LLATSSALAGEPDDVSGAHPAQNASALLPQIAELDGDGTVQVSATWHPRSGTWSGLALAEVRIVGPLSLFGGAQGKDDVDTTHPTLGIAYQARAQELDGYGLRISLAYKPEGFAEPEGELEMSMAIGRRWTSWSAAGVAAYGQEPDAAGFDGELGGLVERRFGASRTSLGISALGHLGRVPDAQESVSWDAAVGPHVGIAAGATSVTGFVGPYVMNRNTDGIEVGAQFSVALRYVR